MGRPSDSVVRGNAYAPRHSLFYALGLVGKELNWPLIGVINACSETVPGHLHLDKITEAVRVGIRMTDGTPIMVPLIGVCDDIATGYIGMKYSLVSRELIADSIETMAKAHGFDGFVLMPNCDRIVPGVLTGALCVNVPSVVMSGGAILPGNDRGKAVSLSAMFEAVGVKKVGLIDQTELTHIERNACPGCSLCSGVFTANSINCLCKVLGIALPDNGMIPVVYSARTQLVKEVGMAAMGVAEKDIRPGGIVNEKPLRNGLACDMTLGCSSNTVLHLLAIVKEAEAEPDLNMINEASQEAPNLYKLASAGLDHIMDLYNVGEVQAVMKELSREQLVDTGLMTVAGKTIAENIATTMNMNVNIIKDIEHSNSATDGIAILLGNIAPKSHIVKHSAVDPKMMTHAGSACMFDNERAAIEAIYASSITKGGVTIICHEGPKDGPSMWEMLNPISALAGMQLDKDVALITDGRFSGTIRGAAIEHVSPETAAQRPIAIIQGGNSTITDTPNGNINLNVDAAEIEQRLQTWEKQEPKIKEGWLYRYSRLVASVDEDAMLK